MSLHVHSGSWIPPSYLGRQLDTLDTALEHETLLTSQSIAVASPIAGSPHHLVRLAVAVARVVVMGWLLVDSGCDSDGQQVQ